MCELAPDKFHSAMGSYWNMTEGVIFIILTLYFRYISKEWRYSVIIGIIEGSLAYASLLLILPESPKWQYDKGLYK